MAKKKVKPPEKWQNCGKNQRFTRIYVSVLESAAIKHLNGNQIALYLYMNAQFKGEETKNNPNGKKEQFYFNWGLANKKYCLYTNQKTFYNDIKALIKFGFIECVENNRNTRSKNIYAFSDEWQKIK